VYDVRPSLFFLQRFARWAQTCIPGESDLEHLRVES